VNENSITHLYKLFNVIIHLGDYNYCCLNIEFIMKNIFIVICFVLLSCINLMAQNPSVGITGTPTTLNAGATQNISITISNITAAFNYTVHLSDGIILATAIPTSPPTVNGGNDKG